jgi:Na+-transporting NADH:ubiquinone oxidoreductase subunit NqrC
MGRGNQQHSQAPVYDKDTKSYQHTKSIGLSQRHKDQHIKEAHKLRGISRQQRALEKAHAKYPFSGKVLWLSVFVFVAVALASLYWVVYLSLPQA